MSSCACALHTVALSKTPNKPVAPGGGGTPAAVDETPHSQPVDLGETDEPHRVGHGHRVEDDALVSIHLPQHAVEHGRFLKHGVAGRDVVEGTRIDQNVRLFQELAPPLADLVPVGLDRFPDRDLDGVHGRGYGDRPDLSASHLNLTYLPVPHARATPTTQLEIHSPNSTVGLLPFTPVICASSMSYPLYGKRCG